nr:MAG TPA: hypothetical protein [Caudoviricetes sp.]
MSKSVETCHIVKNLLLLLLLHHYYLLCLILHILA